MLRDCGQAGGAPGRAGTPPARQPFDVTASFYCRSRRRTIEMARCLDGYLEATAFGRRRSHCWRCPVGRANRERFAES